MKGDTMAFWKNRQSVIQALTSAQFQIERAQKEFERAQREEDRRAMLWHTYKAQKCLKEAAALLVDTTNSSPSLRAFDRTRGNQQAENPDTVDSHEASASRDDALCGNEQSPQSKHVENPSDNWDESDEAIVQQYRELFKTHKKSDTEIKGEILADLIIKRFARACQNGEFDGK